MKTPRRYSVKSWNKEKPMQAASISVGRCKHGGTVGIDLHAQDGHPFAHGHLEVESARKFMEQLAEAIYEAEHALATN